MKDKRIKIKGVAFPLGGAYASLQIAFYFSFFFLLSKNRINYIWLTKTS
jgi:hypothetical protein